MEYVDKDDRMADIFCQLSDMEVDEGAVFLSVQYGHSEQLHPSFFMWWEENFTQMLDSPFCGTCWQWLNKNNS